MSEKVRAIGWVLLGLAALLYAYTGWVKQSGLRYESSIERMNMDLEKRARQNCVAEAEDAAISLAKLKRGQPLYLTVSEGEYLVRDYETSYERCLQRHGIAK